MTFPTHPNAPPLNTLCPISDRLGCLKIEKSGIKKFFSQAAKTYSYETCDGNVTIKAKGFHLFEKLLKDNDKQDLLENNMTQMFSGVFDQSNLDLASAKIFQKQIRVNPIKMVPALIPKIKSYKILNFIGPRRQIDMHNWLTFRFERLAMFKQTVIDPKKIQTDDLCSPNILLTKNDTLNCPLNESRVILVPQLRGVLPALPYGCDPDEIVKQCKFYNLIC